uniref:Uncharacterized protein n=1 Tax=Arundo donax TaxID=35708 RepID=A0A0A9AHZ4_ARUDO
MSYPKVNSVKYFSGGSISQYILKHGKEK